MIEARGVTVARQAGEFTKGLNSNKKHAAAALKAITIKLGNSKNAIKSRLHILIYFKYITGADKKVKPSGKTRNA